MPIYSLDKLMSEARRLAADYRRATGKSLPISGEIAVHDAIRLLDLEPAPEDASYEALRRGADGDVRIQVKGRAIFDASKPGHRLGNLKLEQPWDAVVLVLMDEEYDPVELYEANRGAVMEAVNASVRSRRSARGPISVARFKIISRLVWTRENGREDDGYWDNTTGFRSSSV